MLISDRSRWPFRGFNIETFPLIVSPGVPAPGVVAAGFRDSPRLRRAGLLPSGCSDAVKRSRVTPTAPVDSHCIFELASQSAGFFRGAVHEYMAWQEHPNGGIRILHKEYATGTRPSDSCTSVLKTSVLKICPPVGGRHGNKPCAHARI
jgi:hypothetical protein